MTAGSPMIEPPCDEPTQRPFENAKRLAQFLMHDAVASVLAEVRQAEVERLADNVAAHEHLEAALRAALHSALPFVQTQPAETQRQTHREQVVARILDCINTRYRQPLSLGMVAKEIGMNTAYLSSLFSAALGIPFRSYLKELRLEKAQRLLADPLQHISDIAYAIGYNNPNRFRLDFKALTGLAPSDWREALTARA